MEIFIYSCVTGRTPPHSFRKSALSSAVPLCGRPLTLSQDRSAEWFAETRALGNDWEAGRGVPVHSAEWFAETRALGATPFGLAVYCLLHLRQYLRLTVRNTFSVTTVTRS